MRWLAAGFVTAMFAVAASAASRPDPAPSDGAQAGGSKLAIRACALLPAAEVKKLAASKDQFFDRLPPEEESFKNGGSSCSYSGVHIQVNPFTPARLEELKKEKGNQWSAVADVGDAAYFYDNNRSKSIRFGELYARVGAHVVTVQLDVHPPTASAETVRPAAVALTKALVAKLR